MRRWFGVVLIAACCGLAEARDFGDEGAFWAQSEPLSSTPFLKQDNCYSTLLWLRSCVNSLNKAGELFHPPLRVSLQHDQLVLIRKPPTSSIATTWLEVYRARRKQDAESARQTRVHFRQVASHPGWRFDFERALLEMIRERPAHLPLQMLIGYAINGHLQTYDAHAAVFPRAELDDWQSHSQKSLIGVGVNLDFLSGGVLVHQVFPDSPAQRIGLKDGDQVLAIASDGVHFQSARQSEPNAFYDLLSGPADSPIGIRLRRAQDGALAELHFRRSTFEIPEVESQLLKDGLTGYLVLRSFQSLDTCNEVRQRLAGLQDLGAERLILDLRGNPGGAETAALCVASLFVGEQRLIGRQAVRLNIPSLPDLFESNFRPILWESGNTPQVWRKPVVVLVDALSASASELVAGTLQELRSDIWLVGERTAGKGTVQILTPLLGNPSVQVARTVSRFYLPDGSSTQVVGVTPNFVVPARLNASPADRFYPRERDFFPTTLPAAPDQHEWRDPRARQVFEIGACVNPQAPESDFQLSYALAVLNCLPELSARGDAALVTSLVAPSPLNSR